MGFRNQNAFLNDVKNSGNVFDAIRAASPLTPQRNGNFSSCSAATKGQVLKIAAVIKGLDAPAKAKNSTVPSIATPASSDHTHSRPPSNQAIDLEDFIANKLPKDVVVTAGQRALARRVIQYFNELGPYHEGRQHVSQPLKLLCLGGPGAGKTTITKALAQLSEDCGIGHVVKVSYCGVAAGLMDGTTLLRTFDCAYSKNDKEFVRIFDLSFDRITKLGQRLGFPRIGLIIIDECSTMSPTQLATIDARLRQLTGIDMDFGGIGIILIGDFMQNLPVKQTSFGCAVMEDLLIRRQGRFENSVFSEVAVTTPLSKPATAASPVATRAPHRLHRRTGITSEKQHCVTPETDQSTVTSRLRRKSTLLFSSRAALDDAQDASTPPLPNPDDPDIELYQLDGTNIGNQQEILQGVHHNRSVFRPWTTDETTRIRTALLGTGSIIGYIGTETVRRESLATLHDQEWLDDQIISCFLMTLTKRDKDQCDRDPMRKPNHFFRTFFMTKLLGLRPFDQFSDGRYCYDNVKRWAASVPGTCTALSSFAPYMTPDLSNISCIAILFSPIIQDEIFSSWIKYSSRFINEDHTGCAQSFTYRTSGSNTMIRLVATGCIICGYCTDTS
jgi:hypothetical protein